MNKFDQKCLNGQIRTCLQEHAAFNRSDINTFWTVTTFRILALYKLIDWLIDCDNIIGSKQRREASFFADGLSDWFSNTEREILIGLCSVHVKIWRGRLQYFFQDCFWNQLVAITGIDEIETFCQLPMVSITKELRIISTVFHAILWKY